ncbi:response regulator [Desulfonema magnum]|uniref:histidine kinase n=1 Tax=Desulfonema magnum TaxID=45655 RepID=A0A975GMB6_9BACT|nr:response regulator [Desulfonema magnum]QTA86637.1 Two component system response regulator/histidine kinase, PAS domain-containing [Desulfonema magnum]
MDKQHLLIIDDNSGIRETLSLILKAKGYAPISVSNGKEAIEMVSDRFFHLALIDLMLPDMSGTEVLEEIRTLSPETEAVIITGHASVDTAVQTMHKGAFSYVTKPIDMDYLLAIIARAMEKQKLQREHNNALAALRESEERYRQFFEDNLSGAYISDPEGHLIACNPAFVNIFGFSSVDEAMNTNTESLYADPSELTVFLDQLRKEKKLEHFELKMRRTDGTPVHIVTNTVGVFNEQAELKEIKGYLMDVTNRKHLEMQLRQSKKMEAIGTLAGGIAHDFNNILFPVIGYTDMAMGSLPEDSPVRSDLEEVYKGANRAKELVKQILTLTRWTEYKKTSVKIQPVIKEAMRLLRSSLPSTIEIRQNISKECGYVFADSTQIHQVIMNLCTNAYHAMREKYGVLEVSLEEKQISSQDIALKDDLASGSYLKLTVKDSGQGMSPEVMERIFDPYFTTKDTGKGTGIGLSVVHGIVKSHKGHITVHSEPGKGSVFHVYLPCTHSETRTSETTSDESVISTGHEHILLVDDEDKIVQMEKRMLEQLGYHVTTFTDSRDALEAFGEQPEKFDLVITDMTMPYMTGAELSRKMMRIRPDIPIILCTGFSEMITKEKARDMGIREFITKPARRNQIANTIRRALGN